MEINLDKKYDIHFNDGEITVDVSGVVALWHIEKHSDLIKLVTEHEIN